MEKVRFGSAEFYVSPWQKWSVLVCVCARFTATFHLLIFRSRENSQNFHNKEIGVAQHIHKTENNGLLFRFLNVAFRK